MDVLAILYLVILLLAFVLFTREIFPLEISALFILCLLVFTGILDRNEALSSFGNESLILIGSLFVLSAALTRTGIIKRLEEQLMKISGTNRTLSFVLLMLIVASLSAFVSNTATLAVTIPIVSSIAHNFGENPRRWLMPIAFASVLGGMNSLIGTSTNIIISSLIPTYGLPEFSLFTTSKIGFPILFLGLSYLLIASGKILAGGSDSSSQNVQIKYDIRSYTAEVRIAEDSPLCDKSLAETPLFREADVTVLGISRKGMPLSLPRARFIVRADDTLVVEGNIPKLTEIADRYRLELVEEEQTPPTESGDTVDKKEKKKKKGAPVPVEVEFHEVLVTETSLIAGRTPAEVFLRNRYRISLVAINRRGSTLREKLSQVRISPGDILVVQFLAPVDNTTLEYLGLVPLQILKQERYKVSKAPLAAILFVGALVLGSMTHLPLSICCLAGAVLCVIFGILRTDEVYETIEWRVLIFIGAIICLGKGMEASGLASYLGEVLSNFFVSLPPSYALAFFFVITVVMTQLLSNQATAVVMIPLAISTAGAIGLNPMPFVMSVTIAASCCFVTPFEPAFMLVYGPGGYKFSDFFKLGIFINLMAVIVAIYLIPIFWPLQ